MQRQSNFEQAETYFNEMGDLSVQHKENWIRSYALACLAFLARSQKELIKAKALTKQTLALAVELQDKRQQSLMLELLGLISLELGETARAAKLLGAAKELADTIDVIFDTEGQKVTDLQSQLGKINFETLFSEGQTMSMEEAIALALEA